MALNQKEQQLIQQLQDQETLCIKKYDRYMEQAKDPELKNLFKELKENEQNHFDALAHIKNNESGKPSLTPVDAANYNPKSTYTSGCNTADKENDEFLCTDAISTEKYISTEYNDELFQFASTQVRDTLNQIQTDEQNHANMIYKYKTANGMA